jgi:hypothetical protein
MKSVTPCSHGRAFYTAEGWTFRLYRNDRVFAERFGWTGLEPTSKPEAVQDAFREWAARYDFYVPETLEIAVEY